MSLTGKSNGEAIWNYLKERGFSDAGTAGLLGNLYAESGLRSDNLQDAFEKLLGMSDADYTKWVDRGIFTNFVHDGAGYGLAQWTYWTRKQALLNYAQSTGKSIGDLEMQLEFLCKELDGYPLLLSLLKSTTSVKEASDAVLLQFERPADQSDTMKERRAGYGQYYYDTYARKPATVAAATTSKAAEALKISQSYLTKNPCYTMGKTITVKGLMLHSVGCPQPSAAVFIRIWNSPTYRSACVHGFIDANDGVVYQTLPWNYRAWHCGGTANSTHIGVEMCEPASLTYGSGAKFTCSNVTAAKEAVTRTYNSAVALFASLCEQYNLDPLADGVIISHKEGSARGIASAHADPEHLWTGLGTGYTMDGFRRDVAARLKQNTIKETSAEQAIDRLVSLGVLNSPTYWKQNLGSVPYLDELFVKAAAKITGTGVRASTSEEGIALMVEHGIINSPDYWKAHASDVKYLDALLCALGGATVD